MTTAVSISAMLADPGGLIVQGITGRQGQLETRWMLDSGTHVAAGVTPGKGGQVVHGVPVYDTVEEAYARHASRTSMIYAPRHIAAGAAIEAINAGVRLVVISAEDVPMHDMIRLIEVAKAHDAVVVGPNSQGLLVPGLGRIGSPGGTDVNERFSPGHVAVVSRSGGMTGEIGYLLHLWGLGTSVQIHLGGAVMPAMTLRDGVALAERETATKITVVFGEPSSGQEDVLAQAIADGQMRCPVVAMVAGRFSDTFPAMLPFGHAPRATGDSATNVAAKYAALTEAGAFVAQNFTQLREQVERLTASLNAQANPEVG